MRKVLPAVVVLVLGGGALVARAGADGADAVQHSRLLGRSVLPAETYRPGSEPSGHFLGPGTLVPAPFPGQPVQGFSAIHPSGDGTYLVMSDNGFGAKANSGDFLLWVHRIAPNFTTGQTTVLGGGFGLSDPDGHIRWTIWRDGGCAATTPLPPGFVCPPPDRQLTGWDFDIESMQIDRDGTFWFGDEFGPFLLHTDAAGRVLEAPLPTPGVTSPSNPTLGGAVPNLANSRGYEGMAVSPRGDRLYPMLEGSVTEDQAIGLAADLRIFTVKLRKSGAEFEDGFWRYRMEHPGNAIGDFIAVDDDRFIVIERDGGSGPTARFKTLFLVDSRDRDNDGYVDKQLLVNLLAVPNPDQASGITDAFFTFPFVTIEDVAIIDDHTLVVLNDNNFPGGGGRADDVPDNNEFILIELDQSLRADRRLLPG